MGIKERVIAIVSEVECLPIEKTTTELVIMDIGDSLEAVELQLALEQEFGIEIPDEDAEKMITVGDIVNFIQDKSGD